MFKKKTLWFTLTLTVMLLFGFSMNTYASETVTDTTNTLHTAETASIADTASNESSNVITVGEAETLSTENAASEHASEDTPAEHTDTASSTQTGLQSLGIFRTTGYCPCYRCSEGWGRATSTGATAQASHTIAVDPRVIPYGTKLMIGGVVYTAEDRGGGVKGRHIDIFFDEHTQTRQHGSRQQEVFLIS